MTPTNIKNRLKDDLTKYLRVNGFRFEPLDAIIFTKMNIKNYSSTTKKRKQKNFKECNKHHKKV